MIQLAYVNDKGEAAKRFIEPQKLLGEAFGVHLKDGGSFYFKCTGNGCVKFDNVIQSEHLEGRDTEGTDLRIDLDDIDFVSGVTL
jgi:hypothetical protein